MTVVIGTAGHIDHGKTSLLRALTGIDADRLPEERARGMTIDVGYAHLALPDGTELDFVDVPGHEDLVGNMLVGAGEIDAALLVVAADDGPRAQTSEHLELLDALGVEEGLAVVTKVDAVDPSRVDEVAGAIRALLTPTRLRGIPIVAVSATRGDGLDALGAALIELRDRVVARAGERGRGPAGGGTRRGARADRAGEPDGGPSPVQGSRLAIDRVFPVRGRGTVVTGTLRGAPLVRGAILRVVPGAEDRTARAREVQVHGRTVDRAEPGRVALNLAGDAVADLQRGVVLATDPTVVGSDRLLVALRPAARLGGRAAPGSPAGALPPDRTAVTVHLGTVRVGAVVGRAGRDAVDLDAVDLDELGTAILRLDRPIAVAPGDRFVVRRPSPVVTLAGGRVLDPLPTRGVARRRTTPDRMRALATAEPASPAWTAARLELHGVTPGPPPAVAGDVAGAIDEVLLATVEARPGIRSAELVRNAARELRRLVGVVAPAEGPAVGAGGDVGIRIADGRLDALVAGGRLTREADRVLPAGAVPVGPSPALSAAMDRLVAALSAASPPPLALAAHDAGCPPEGVRLLEQAGRIVRLADDLAWASATWEELATRALALAAVGPLTPAAYRDATGTSRKYVMAILEDLDRRAILRRTPAGHVPGPRAAQLHASAPTPAADPVPR